MIVLNKVIEVVEFSSRIYQSKVSNKKMEEKIIIGSKYQVLVYHDSHNSNQSGKRKIKIRFSAFLLLMHLTVSSYQSIFIVIV
ncbi:MAG: hypothetical protein ACJ71P_16200 [Nitrososphaeraceae archaeon]